jgi:hypothetical protein
MTAQPSYEDFVRRAEEVKLENDLEALAEEVRRDPGYPFHPAVLERLAGCKLTDPQAFHRIRGVFDRERVHMRSWDEAVANMPAQPNGHDKQPVAFLSAAAFVAGYKPRRPLIRAWDTKPGWLYSFTAPTGYAKTAIALCEAMNQALAGRSVIYLAGENPDDVRARVLLMQDKMAIRQLPPSLRFIDRTFNMPDTADMMREEVRAIGGADLIFVDTSPAFQAASGAIEENSNTEQLRWAMLLRQMTKLEGAPAVVALCHPPKRPMSIEECSPRGGGSFLAEVDGNYVSWQKADDGERQFFDFSWTGKFRGGFDPISYVVEIATCAALIDPAGKPIKTAWAHRADDAVVDRATAEQSSAEDDALKAMKDYPGKSLAEWATLLGWQKYQMQRVVKRLAADNLVRRFRGHYRLTNTGKEEAKRASENIRRTAE